MYCVIQDLLEAAEYFQVAELKRICVSQLISQVEEFGCIIGRQIEHLRLFFGNFLIRSEYRIKKKINFIVELFSG
jgi:hypothetical protein